jgi:glycosyltransferase involved in cell wall biosynthesis
MMKATIVIVCDQASKTGGHARVAIESAAGLAESGEDVIYFASHGPIDEELTASGAKVVLTNQPDSRDDKNRLRGGLRGIWNVNAGKLLSELIERNRSNRLIFHVHGWTKSLSPSVLSVILSSRCPVVCTLHEFFSVCPNGLFFNFQSNKICELAPMGRMCLWTNCDSRSYNEKLWRVARQFVAERIAKFPSAVSSFIYTTDFSKSIISKYLPANANYYYVPNPVFVKKRPPVNASKNSSLIYIGRLALEKGILPAAEIIYRRKFAFEIAGSGEISDEVRNANPDAKLHGWLNADGLNALFDRARVLVFPSLWYETYGLVIYEALARGVPVIGARETAAGERIIDDYNGRLFSWKNPDEFDKALLSASDTPTVERWSKCAYADYWKTPVTIESHIETLKYVYEQTLSRTSGQQKTFGAGF